MLVKTLEKYPIDKGEVDAINVYSTDGQLAAQDLVALEDDKDFNPPYNGVLVARNDTVGKYSYSMMSSREWNMSIRCLNLSR